MSEIFSKRCERITPSDPESENIMGLCGKPAKIWHDLRTIKYGKDKTPYCKDCHNLELEYLEIKCRKCLLINRECICE